MAAQEFTKKSQQSLNQSQYSNPTLKELDPEIFEPTAKKCSSIWNTQQYKGPDFRENLNKTTNRQNIVAQE